MELFSVGRKELVGDCFGPALVTIGHRASLVDPEPPPTLDG